MSSILRDLWCLVKTTTFHFKAVFGDTIWPYMNWPFLNFNEPLWLKVVEWGTIEWAWRRRAFSLDKAEDGAYPVSRPTFWAKPASQSNYDADADAKEMQWRRRLKFKFESGNLRFHFIDVAASWNKSIWVWFCKNNYTPINAHVQWSNDQISPPSFC